MKIIFFLMLGVLALVSTPSSAEWKPEYAQLPQATQDWYKRAELTPAAQERFGWKNCCAHADVFRTKFLVNKTSGNDEWFYQLPNGNWKRISPDIIHWGESAPDKQPTLFIYLGNETCFYPGDGGI